MRGSRRSKSAGGASARALILAGAVVLSAGACSGRTIVAVDPLDCGGRLREGLVGYWRLDDGRGSSTAQDSSGQNNTGTLVGLDPSTTWTTSRPQGGFRGSLAVEGKGHVNVPRSESLDGVTDQVTVAAWMLLDGPLTDYATAISRQIGTGFGQTYHLSVNTQMLAGLFITTPSFGQIFINSSVTVPSQKWLHLAGTYDGAEARLYVDGVQVASTAITGVFAPETNPVILAGNANGGAQTIGESIPGRLAGVLLYQRALSSDEIVLLHACGPLSSTGTIADAGDR